jgi:hypothetical protein
MAPKTAAPPRGIRPPSGGGGHEHTGNQTVTPSVSHRKERCYARITTVDPRTFVMPSAAAADSQLGEVVRAASPTS